MHRLGCLPAWTLHPLLPSGKTAKTFIDRLQNTDIVQMHYLSDLVAKSGYAKAEEVLSPEQYKAI